MTSRRTLRSARSSVPSLVTLGALGALASVACACGGGAAGAKGASDPSKAPTADTVSIGDSAAAQGGLTALGGGANKNAADAALAGSLRFDRLDGDAPVKLDGVLREWPARTAAKTAIKGSADGASFAVALQYDAAKIYVGGEVTDDAFVRTSRFGDGEDHASLALAFPVGAGGALAVYEIGLFAGKPGETTGAVRFVSGSRRGQDVPGAKIVEAPAGGGYTFEASIPWSAFAEGRHTRVGLRGVARYYDASRAGAIDRVLATSAGDPASAASLPPLPTEPETAIAEGLLAAKGLLGASPRFDLVVDLVGDAMKERVTVYDKYLTICGPTYRGGREYFYREIDGDLVRLDAREITGRPKQDLLARRRFTMAGTNREWFEVWSILPNGDEPQTTFAQEIAVVSGPKHLDNAVHVGGKEIEVSVEPAAGWDPGSYREPVANDVNPILFPWGAVRSRTYRFDGSRFVKAREIGQQPAAGASGASAAGGAGGAGGGESVTSTLAAARAEEPPTPAVTKLAKGSDLSAQVLDQYKRDRGLPESTTPRIDLQVQATGDARPERVALVGRDIVVFGPGFKNGTGYASLSLTQFADAGDVKDLTARDLNGDGAADLVVRGVRRVTASGSREPVEIEAMFVYEVRGDQITRVFGIETAREQGGKRIQGLVQFVPVDRKQFEIDVRPGMAKGWSEKSYPWAQDTPGAGALEPLLLPWGGIASLRYAWNGSAFALKQ